MTKQYGRDIGTALSDCLMSPNESDRNLEPANVVDGLFAIARAVDRLANAIHKLGTADAATPMGAIETHNIAVRDAAERIAEAIESGRSPL